MPLVDTGKGSLLKNPLGGITSYANKKLDQSIDRVKALGDAEVKKTLDKIGIPFDRIEKLEKISAEARRHIEKARNYGLESVADFAGKASNVQSFMARNGGDSCDVASSVFGFANDAGRFLCNQLGTEVGAIDTALSKIQSYADLAMQGLDQLQEIEKRAEAFVRELDGLVGGIGDRVKQIGNDIISGIESELEAYSGVLEANSRAHLEKILAGFTNDKCISSMTNNLMSEAGKALANRK